MQAVFSQNYVKRLNGTNVKNGKTKMELAEQLIADIANLGLTKNRKLSSTCCRNIINTG
jgi:hypothetical protein